MSESSQDDETFLIAFSDGWKILKKNVFKIALGSIFFALLLGAYTLTKPIQYEAEATFKEKSNKQSGLNTSSLASMIFNGFNTGGQSEARTLMRSRKLLKDLIKPLNLQGTLIKKTRSSALLNRIRENLIVETHYYNKRLDHPLPDPEVILSVQNIEFQEEIPLVVTLVFDSEHTFQVYDNKEINVGTGRIGTPFSTKEFRFTISRVNDTPVTSDTYVLTLSPLKDVAYSLSQCIDIEPDKDDTSLLRITFLHRDRHLACDIINELMTSYQNYLKQEQERISQGQIVYLHRREREMGHNLKEMIEDYANQVSAGLSTIGYADSEKAMNFLSAVMETHRKKLFDIELELKREQRLKEEGIPYNARHQSARTPDIVNNLLVQIIDLKQQSDAIELALRNSSTKNIQSWHDSFHQQVADLNEIRQSSEDASVVLAALSNDRYTLPSVQLLDNPKYMVKPWVDQLFECQKQWENALGHEKERKKADLRNFQGKFVAYLTNLQHFLKVSEKTIEERLIHQQAPQFEFQGIDLGTAKELYLAYSKELNTIEAQILQNSFLIDQLKEPTFEVSSLSAVSTDPVTIGLVNKASESVLAMQDEANRSLREKERIQWELTTHKRFLDIHLNQTIQLLHLREDLYKDKIQSLQNATLELIQQQVSILEKQLADSIDNHIQNLKQERQLIEQHQLELRSEMALLPQRWASEKLIDQQLQLNASMVEELTKLVESKNIANNLEMIQSAPIDIALPPIKPKRPRVIIFSFLGALLGALLTTGAILAWVVVRGVSASEDNLKLAGAHVSGSIGDDDDNNLDTFRRLSSFLSATGSSLKGGTLAFISGKGVDSSEDIATLLSKKGMKVLLLDMSFDHLPETEHLPGLLQYLENEADKPQILSGNYYDTIAAGGHSPYAIELLGSRRFKDLMDELKSQYDWIIGQSSVSADSPEVEGLMQSFDYSVVNVSGETLQSLHHLIEYVKDTGKDKKTSFIVS